MPAHTRMKILLLEGFLLLYLISSCFTLPTLEPGFLDFDNLPDTNFSCYGKVVGGYYADLETSCQMFHVCTYGPMEEAMDIRFLCLNGTVFDQETRVCERIDEVDCSKSETFYDLNLKLYGDTLPPILKEPSEKQKPSSSTSTTSPTKKSSTPRPYYPSPSPTVTATTTRHPPKVITTHHFPVSANAADIRFNPEEINISLKPGIQRPDIRPNPISYQQSSNYNSNGDKSKRVIVTTHTTVYKTSRKEGVDKISSTATPNPIDVYRNNNNPTPTELNYDFNYDDGTESPEYRNTESYKYDEQIDRHQQRNHQRQQPQVSGQSTYRPPQISTGTHRISTTFRQPSPTPLVGTSSTVNVVQPYHYSTEKPSRLQLPLPLLPTLPPLIFSTPAPFTSATHRQRDDQEDVVGNAGSAKRYSEHHVPRIVISASASVSDASGRKLNYTFGPLETSQIFDSYEDYKEDDDGVEAFYHDVPKLKKSEARRRRKRGVDESTDVAKDEEQAIGVLKFLFDWYATNSNRSKIANLTIPLEPLHITEINDELTQSNVEVVTLDYSGEVADGNDTSVANLTEGIDRLHRSQNASDGLNLLDYGDDDSATNETNEAKEYRKKSIGDTDLPPRQDVIDPNDYVDDNYLAKLPRNESTIGHEETVKNTTDNDAITTTDEQNDAANEHRKKPIGDADLPPRNDVIDPNDYVDDNYEANLYEETRNESTIAHEDARKNTTDAITTSNVQNDSAKDDATESDYYYDEYIDDNYEPQLHKQQAKKNKTDTGSLDYDAAEYVDDNYEAQLYEERMLLKRLYDITSGDKEDKDPDKGRVESNQEKKQESDSEKKLDSLDDELEPKKEAKLESNKEEKLDENEEQESSEEKKQEEKQVPNNADQELSNDEEYKTNQEVIKEPIEEKNYETNNEETIELSKEREHESKEEELQAPSEGMDQDPKREEIKTARETDPPEKTLDESKEENNDEEAIKKQDIADEEITTERPSTATVPRQIEDNSVEGDGDDGDFESTIASYETTTTITSDIADDALHQTGRETTNPPEDSSHSTDYLTTANYVTVAVEAHDATTTVATSLDVHEITATPLPNDLEHVHDVAESIRPSSEIKNDFGLDGSQPVDSKRTENEHGDKNHRGSTVGNARSFRNRGRKRFESGNVPSTPGGSYRRGRNRSSAKRTTTTTTTEAIPTSTTLHFEVGMETSLPEPNEHNSPKAPDSGESMQNDNSHKADVDGATNKANEPDGYTETTKSIDLLTFVKDIESSTKSVAHFDLPTTTESYRSETDRPTEAPSRELTITESAEPETALPESLDRSPITTNVPPSTVTESSLRQTTVAEATTLFDTVSSQIPSVTHDYLDRSTAEDYFDLAIVADATTVSTTSSTTTTAGRWRGRQRTRAPTRTSTRRQNASSHRFSYNSNRRSYNRNGGRTTTSGYAAEDSARNPIKTTEDAVKADVALTEAPLSKSANPTLAKDNYNKRILTTTPLTKLVRIQLRKEKVNKNYVFNCFDKKINRFYSDPRDCRLFHYCTPGYTKNQLLDMKFVCDFGTYFDDAKLICTRTRPTRCT